MVINAETLSNQSASSESDSLSVERIDRALWADDALRSTNHDDIKIKCTSGIVRLSGHVTTKLAKTRAEDAVRSVPNVTNVENDLTADEDLVHLVAQALAGDAQLKGNSIGVNVQHGFVYLFGTVGGAAVRRIAAKIAATVPEVRGIINHIQTPTIVLLDAEEDRILQPGIGKEVFFVDNRSGRIEQVIINPNSRRVTGLIARVDFLTPTIVIPTAAIRYASTAGIFLSVNSGAASNFIASSAAGLILPPADWQPPYPYGAADVRLMSAPPAALAIVN